MVEKPLYVSVNQTNDADTEWNPRSSRKSLALEIYNREESKDPDSYPEKAIHKTLRIGQERSWFSPPLPQEKLPFV
jgi:hypothetical protein